MSRVGHPIEHDLWRPTDRALDLEAHLHDPTSPSVSALVESLAGRRDVGSVRRIGSSAATPSGSHLHSATVAYDEALEERVREALQADPAFSERKMFSGLCFTLAGHMCAGVVGDRLMLRLGPTEPTLRCGGHTGAGCVRAVATVTNTTLLSAFSTRSG